MKTHFSDADGSRCEDLTDWKALGAESVVLKLKEFCFSQENAGLLTPGFLFETDERRMDELESVLRPMHRTKPPARSGAAASHNRAKAVKPRFVGTVSMLQAATVPKDAAVKLPPRRSRNSGAFAETRPGNAGARRRRRHPH